MKAKYDLTNEDLQICKAKSINREQKRRLMKAYHIPMKMMNEVFKPKVNVEYDTFIEGSKVTLNYDRIMEHTEELSQKYIEFVKEHKEKIMTIEYEPKYGENPTVFCLKEDEGEVKWYFDISDLNLVAMADPETHLVDEDSLTTENVKESAMDMVKNIS